MIGDAFESFRFFSRATRAARSKTGINFKDSRLLSSVILRVRRLIFKEISLSSASCFEDFVSVYVPSRSSKEAFSVLSICLRKSSAVTWLAEMRTMLSSTPLPRLARNPHFAPIWFSALLIGVPGIVTSNFCGMKKVEKQIAMEII